MAAMRFVKVRFGSDGSQWAMTTGRVPRTPGCIQVRKWRANSRKWTGAVTIPKTDVIDWRPDETEARKAVGWS